MQKKVVALVVAMLALTLVGCSGGGDKATTTEETPAAKAPAVAPPTGDAVAPDKSSNDYDYPPTAFPSFTTTSTPAVFQEKLDAGRPMLILFYDTRQDETTDLRAEVDAVMNEYRGLVDLITFNLAGEVTDPNVLAGAQYASELGVPSTPYLIIVDKDGFIIWRNKGFAERGIIEREVERSSK